MRSLVRRLVWLVAAVVVVLLAAKLLVTLPRFAERWIGETTGLHVTMHGAGLRLMARAVVMNEVRFALDEDTPPFLHVAELDWYPGQRLLVITDPVIDLGPDQAGPAPAPSAGTTASRLEAGRLQVSGARIAGVDATGAERTHALPPFFVEHQGIDFERGATDWTIRAALSPGLGQIGIESSWHRRDGGLAWRLVADLDHVDVPDAGARGATGRLVYERTAPPLAPRDHLSGDLEFADVSVSPDGGAVSGHAGLQVQGMAIDLLAKHFQSERITLREGETIIQPEVDGPLLPLPAGWTVGVANVLVEQLRVRAGRLPTLGITSLSIRDVGSEAAWPVALTGRLAVGGTVEANGTLAPGATTYVGSLTLTDVELAAWVNPFFPRLEVNEGRLDARLAFDGRPGLRGDGSLTVRDLVVKARTARTAAARPFLALREAHVGDAAVTLVPWDARLGTVRLSSPTLAVRRDDAGWGPTALLDGQDDATARRARETVRGLGARLPVSPGAPAGLDDRAVTAQASARDVSIEVTNTVAQPPRTVRLTQAEGHAEIEAAPPWSWRRINLQGRTEPAAPFEFRIERDATRLSARGRLGPGPLEPWNPHLTEMVGHLVRSGRARLEVGVEWETDVEATIGVMLDGVVAEPASGADPVVEMLGIPLARTLALLTDPAGPTEFSVRVQGDASEPALGLPVALRDTLRRTLTDAIVVPLFDAASLRTEDGIEYVQLAPLAFRAGESVLGEAAVDTLDRLSTLLHWEERWLVFVQGRDGTGETQPSETVRLADERAAAVRHHLTKVRGVRADQVEVEDPETGTPGVRLDLLPAS